MSDTPEWTETLELYGRELPVQIKAPDDLIADVIVMARAVRVDDDGYARDEFYVSVTPNTTPAVMEGILRNQLRYVEGHPEAT